jgi:hypothetical protein
MRIVRPCVFVGVAYSLPVIVWTLATAANGVAAAKPLSPFMLQSMTALFWLQGLAVALIMPLISISEGFRTALINALALIGVPLPAFAFLWLAMPWSLAVIIKAQLLILGAALLLTGAGRALSLGKLNREVRPYAVAGLQLAAVTFVWVFREESLRWLVL